MGIVLFGCTAGAISNRLFGRCVTAALLISVAGQVTAQPADVVMTCIWREGGNNLYKVAPDALLSWNSSEWAWIKIPCFRDTWRKAETDIFFVKTDICQMSISEAEYKFENTYHSKSVPDLPMTRSYYDSMTFVFNRYNGDMRLVENAMHIVPGSPDEQTSTTKYATCKRVADPVLSARPKPVL